MDETEYQVKVTTLRDAAEKSAQDPNPRVAYFASWLVFYIDQHRATRAAWEASIERMMPK